MRCWCWRGAIASAFSPGIWWLIGFRAILGFGHRRDYPVSATIMSEYASKQNRGRMVSLVFSMQGLGLVFGPLLAIGLLATGMSETWCGGFSEFGPNTTTFVYPAEDQCHASG